jgi:phage head maturation protease
MDGHMEIRGIAAPYGVVAPLSDGTPTVIEAGAFALAGSMARLLAGDHGADAVAGTLDGSLELHDIAGFGLGFRAWIPLNRAGHGVLGPLARGDMAGASVSMFPVLARDVVTQDGVAAQRITRCKLDHIALCSSPCYGDLTGAWLAEVEDSLSPRLADFAGRLRAAIAASPQTMRA